jgi:hypothetical protein
MKCKLVRSRAQWVDEGEKPTKYFCGLESKNYTSKIIPKVEKDNGEIVKLFFLVFLKVTFPKTVER